VVTLMKLAMLQTPGGPMPAISTASGFVSVAEVVGQAPPSLEALIREQDRWLPALREAATGAAGDTNPASLLAPMTERSVIAIGLNYYDHCREFGTPPPEAPIVFVKLPSSIIGPGEDITWDPEVTSEVDWEAELGVVIGRPARNVNADDAGDIIFGYTAVNDVTARDIQRREAQWVRAKSLETFCPLGPVVVTRDELDLRGGIAIRSWVNGAQMQDSSTSELIFGVDELVAYLSRSFTLQPGDVIATGTPLGVGAFRTPPVFLRDGDVVEVELEGIGRLRNTCRVVGKEQA
jgi:2-keto-4-pentenoate hydratase/2-oxohepta-3-ene-1,7-dioic acid hydratase in catechol pathway